MNRNLSRSLSAAKVKLAETLMPGGVSSPVRAFKSVDLPPVLIKRAHGDKIYDIDGNEYIDYVMSYGPMILGHADDRVVKAVCGAAAGGFSYGATTEGEIELAELIKKHFPSMEMTRLVNSGTEAVMSAIRLARGFTQRSKIVKFEGCYHGHSDSMLVKAGSGALTTSVPSSAGITEGLSKDTLVAVYNDLDSVKKLFLSNGGDIAAVIIEPVAANMGTVLPEEGFLKNLLDLSHENGAVVIFDEVITGFRLSIGGAQGLFGLKPDITCLGKIIGGGLPIGAFGGRKDIMEYLSPLGPVYQAGTLSGNPVCTAAGIATIKAIEEDDAVSVANEAAEYLIKNLKDELKGFSAKITINGMASLLTIFFKGVGVHNFKEVMQADTNAFKKFFSLTLDGGLFIAPSPYVAMFLGSSYPNADLASSACARSKAVTNAYKS